MNETQKNQYIKQLEANIEKLQKQRNDYADKAFKLAKAYMRFKMDKCEFTPNDMNQYNDAIEISLLLGAEFGDVIEMAAWEAQKEIDKEVMEQICKLASKHALTLNTNKGKETP